jgi:hypothetical protein
MEGKALFRAYMRPGAKIVLTDTVIEFNAPMTVWLMRREDIMYRVGTMIDISEDLVLNFSLDKGVRYDTRTTIPEAPEVC